MQAIILAAGMGKRLGTFTADNTKCMVKVNGERLIDRMLSQLKSLQLSRIIIVTGYRGENLRSHIRKTFPTLEVLFIDNDIFDQTNNIYSLWLAREYMGEDDTLLLESDLIFKPGVLNKLIDAPYKDCALVSKYDTWMDGTMVTIDEDKNIVNFIPKKAFDYAETSRYFKTVNIYKFSQDFIRQFYLPLLEAYIKVLGENEYYEQVLRVISFMDAVEIKAVEIPGQVWYEIDDAQDLAIAETLAASPAERLKKMTAAGGGYWRYQDLLDLSNLTNPFFPSSKIMSEIKANFDQLLVSTPSNCSIPSKLAAKNYNVERNSIVSGVSTPLFISRIINFIGGKTGFVTPISEKYVPQTVFEAENSPYRYYNNPIDGEYPPVEELMKWIYSENLKSIVIQSPNFWNGQSYHEDDIIKLARFCDHYDCLLIIDNTLSDFSDKDSELLNNNLLTRFNRLIILKESSIAFGVPGLKLSAAATSNFGLYLYLMSMAIDGAVNSFGEFFLQISSKYEKDYRRALMQLKRERLYLEDKLSTILYLNIIHTETNYILCRVKKPFTARELRKKLLDYKILVADCDNLHTDEGTDDYIRISIGTREENDRLIKVLRHLDQ